MDLFWSGTPATIGTFSASRSSLAALSDMSALSMIRVRRKSSSRIDLKSQRDFFLAGNFSFGSFTRFKSNTIVDFVENAVEHSRSGRYLFFLNRRPTNGPMRVQLLHPVSRARRVQSLQHMCRYRGVLSYFAILFLKFR